MIHYDLLELLGVCKLHKGGLRLIRCNRTTTASTKMRKSSERDFMTLLSELLIRVKDDCRALTRLLTNAPSMGRFYV
jgi:hypothetical protein